MQQQVVALRGVRVEKRVGTVNGLVQDQYWIRRPEFRREPRVGLGYLQRMNPTGLSISFNRSGRGGALAFRVRPRYRNSMEQMSLDLVGGSWNSALGVCAPSPLSDSSNYHITSSDPGEQILR